MPPAARRSGAHASSFSMASTASRRRCLGFASMCCARGRGCTLGRGSTAQPGLAKTAFGASV
eukprot:7218324-Alexandrium_andersonii.AAC.1